jgi:WhiB family redox-sensing transcriptional regulator
MRYAGADWRSRGACLSVDPELFFPLSSAGPAAEQISQAKSVCTRCQVRSECLDFALATRQVHGVWGGTSEDERRRILARIDSQSARRRAKAPTPAALLLDVLDD